MRSMINRFHAKLRIGQVVVLAILAAGGLAGLVILGAIRWGLVSSPEVVARQYLASLYARDYEQTYQFISAADKAYKSQEDYLRENVPFTGFGLEAARQLASYIEYPEIETDQQGDRATLTLKFRMPDGNDPAVRDILFAASHSPNTTLTPSERQALLKQLDELHKSGQIPTFEGEQTLELVKEPGGWRIFEDWAAAVRVHFSGEVKDGLPWEFEPLQEMILAKPGETLQALYRVKNLSDRPIVAKARHIDRPEAYQDFLNIIQCFCLVQQTLRPGEEAKLPLVFRVEWDVPAEVKDFYVHYEFYPLESFPEDSTTSKPEP